MEIRTLQLQFGPFWSLFAAEIYFIMSFHEPKKPFSNKKNYYYTIFLQYFCQQAPGEMNESFVTLLRVNSMSKLVLLNSLCICSSSSSSGTGLTD